MSSNAYNAPPPLRVEEVPNGLICSICFGIPLRPKITPCEHVFCDGCAESALAATAACPNCRLPCALQQLRTMPPGTFMHIAWSTVMVKCLWHEQGCVWNGSIADAATHLESCVHGHDNNSRITPARLALIQSQEENTMLKQEIRKLNWVRVEHERLISQHDQQVSTLSRDRRMQLPILFHDDNYNYDRGRVVELSQLISRYLENKPAFINSNRIFICVRNCYTDLCKGYQDNPKHYKNDMRMLLSTCATTGGWFTDKQREHIRLWLVEQG